MATYKGIQGYSVQKLSDDPTASEAAGQLWYNSTSGKFKIAVAGAGAWAAGGNLNTARQVGFNFGTQTAAIFASGYTGSNVANTESYNGSAWTEVGDVNSAFREPGGSFGTQTAGIKAGGRPPTSNETESWNGSSWTVVNALQTAISDSDGGTGVSTAGIIAGGYTTTYLATSQTYDGTSWATANSLNTARSNLMRSGITKDTAICAGGSVTPGATGETETYDGTSWTEVNNLTTARYTGGGGGPSTSGLVFGGTPSPTGAKTENWDGTSWTEVADLATARYGMGSGSNSPGTTNIAFGGYISPAASNLTEEWNDPVYTSKTVTVS